MQCFDIKYDMLILEIFCAYSFYVIFERIGLRCEARLWLLPIVWKLCLAFLMVNMHGIVFENKFGTLSNLVRCCASDFLLNDVTLESQLIFPEFLCGIICLRVTYDQGRLVLSSCL